jgi:hypothetical protein
VKVQAGKHGECFLINSCGQFLDGVWWTEIVLIFSFSNTGGKIVEALKKLQNLTKEKIVISDQNM